MQAMIGDYMSDEAETTIKVVLTPKGLEIHQRPDTVYPLQPTYADGFECDLGSVRFVRDTQRPRYRNEPERLTRVGLAPEEDGSEVDRTANIGLVRLDGARSWLIPRKTRPQP